MAIMSSRKTYVMSIKKLMIDSKSKYRKYALIILVVLMCLIVAFCLWQAIKPKSKFSASIKIDQEAYYPVTHVLDGDTFKVKIGKKEITVRMLGIDTPETVDPRKPSQCYGNEASNETKKLLASTTVQLMLNPKREVLDKYGRYLAYVYLSNGILFNEYLLKNGFAREYTYGKAYSMQKEFKAVESDARKKKMGLWGRCVNSGSV